jgi:hypothetical protein
VAVLEHSLRSSQRPAAYLDIAGRRVRVLELVLSLTLNIEALTLTITDRRVTGFGPTTASSTAELAVELPMGGTHTLLKQELGRVVLLPYRVHNAVHASPGATSPAIP